MHAPSDDTLAPLVVRAEQGDRPAREALFTALYADLHRLAQAQLRRAPGPLTLGTTTLLHEAYLEISERDAAAFPDRNRFLGYAARAMRGLIINYVRDRGVQKRGGDLTLSPSTSRATARPDGPPSWRALAPLSTSSRRSSPTWRSSST